MRAERLLSAQRVSQATSELVDACRGCCTGAALRAAFDEMVREPVPQQLIQTLRNLGG